MEPANVLVVGNPDDSAEIERLLVQAGVTVSATGSGGDDTLSTFQRAPADVVVLCANLDAGDARSLATAIRGSAPRHGVGIVLVGETRGPIRNALDAADFDVDRFVGRPLAAKALAYAVNASRPPATPPALTAVPAVPAVPDAPIAEAADRTVDEDAAADAPADATPEAPSGVPTPVADDLTERLDAATNDAINAFLSEAIDLLPQVQLESEIDELWNEPPAPEWREPTLILSDGGRSADPPQPRSPPSPPLPPPPVSPSPPPRSDAPASAPAHRDSVPSLASVAARIVDRHGTGTVDLDDDVENLDDDDDVVDLDDVENLDDLDEFDERTPIRQSPVSATAVDAAAADRSGGSFARELRRKMSAMAERLFPGQSGPIDVGAPHDPHTEIDLTSLGVDTVSGASYRGPGPFEDLSTADTFADLDSVVAPPQPASGTPSFGEIDTSTSRAGTVARDGQSVAVTRARRPSSPPSMRGNIDTIEDDVASLLARYYEHRFTGRATFRDGTAEKHIYFDNGRPVFAASNLPHDRMGDLLYREGKITRDQHARSREIVAESGRRMGEILVEMGFLKRRELLPAVRRHIEDIIYSLFSWDSGEYVTQPADSATSEKIRLSRHPAAIIFEGVRRKYSLAVLERRIGTEAAVVAPIADDAIAAVVREVDLSPLESRVVEALDGERSIADIVDLTGADSLTVFQLAYGLVVLGVAIVVQQANDAVTWSEASRAPSLVGATDLSIDRQRVLAKHALVGDADYFMLLGVRRDASKFEIRRAYESARRDYASECFPAEVRRELGAEIAEINELLEEAYRVLRDDDVRTAYREHLRD